MTLDVKFGTQNILADFEGRVADDQARLMLQREFAYPEFPETEFFHNNTHPDGNHAPQYLRTAHWPKRPPLKLNELYWPVVGASRFAVAHFLVQNAVTTGKDRLKVTTDAGLIIDVDMWPISCRPLVVEESDLHILTVVDERFWWRFQPFMDVGGPDPVFPSEGTWEHTWKQVIRYILGNVPASKSKAMFPDSVISTDATTEVKDIIWSDPQTATDFLFPNVNQIWRQAPQSVLLDKVLNSVGMRYCSTPYGTNGIRRILNKPTAGAVHMVGSISSEDKNSKTFEKIVFNFQAEQHGSINLAAPYTSEILWSASGSSITAANVAAGTCLHVSSSVVACRPDQGGAPTNQTALDNLTKEWAKSFWDWRERYSEGMIHTQGTQVPVGVTTLDGVPAGIVDYILHAFTKGLTVTRRLGANEAIDTQQLSQEASSLDPSPSKSDKILLKAPIGGIPARSGVTEGVVNCFLVKVDNSGGLYVGTEVVATYNWASEAAAESGERLLDAVFHTGKGRWQAGTWDCADLTEQEVILEEGGTNPSGFSTGFTDGFDSSGYYSTGLGSVIGGGGGGPV